MERTVQSGEQIVTAGCLEIPLPRRWTGVRHVPKYTATLATPQGREQCERWAPRNARWHDAFADAGIGWPRSRHDPGRFAWSADRSRTSLATGRGRDKSGAQHHSRPHRAPSLWRPPANVRRHERGRPPTSSAARGLQTSDSQLPSDGTPPSRRTRPLRCTASSPSPRRRRRPWGIGGSKLLA